LEELSRQKIIEIFKASWNELADEFSEKSVAPIYCCEADIQLHLANKLLNKLPTSLGNVHMNLPVPIKVERWHEELEIYGRPIAREHIIPDIVVTDESFDPCLIGEIKFKPLDTGFIPHYKLLKRLESGEEAEDEEVEALRKWLTEDITRLERFRKKGPSTGHIEYYLKNVEKLVKVLKNFKIDEEIDVVGYLCVIDELFPDLEERLKQAVKKYDPPTQLEILVEHFDLIESLEQIRKKIV